MANRNRPFSHERSPEQSGDVGKHHFRTERKRKMTREELMVVEKELNRANKMMSAAYDKFDKGTKAEQAEQHRRFDFGSNVLCGMNVLLNALGYTYTRRTINGEEELIVIDYEESR